MAAVALAARLIIVAESGPTLLVRPVYDGRADEVMARRIADGDLAAGPSAFGRPPLYPYLLAAFDRLGIGALGVRLFHSLLGTTTAVLIAMLGARAGGPGIGMAAGLGAALYGPEIAFEGQLSAITLALSLATAGLFLFERSRSVAGRRGAALAGLCFGLGTLARPDIFFVGLVVASGFVAIERPGPARRAAMFRAAVCLTTALSVSLLATVHNAVVGRDLVWVSADDGIHFTLSNNPEPSVRAIVPGGRDWRRLIETPNRDAGLTGAGNRSRYYYRQALREMAAHPGEAARLFLAKVGRLVAGPELGGDEDLYVMASGSRFLRMLLWRAGPLGFPFGILLPLALLGLPALWRRPELNSIGLYAAAQTAMVLVYGVSPASRLPIALALLPVAALAGEPLLERSRIPVKGLRYALSLGILILLVNANPAVLRLDAQAARWRLTAASESEHGDPTAAVKAQERAVAADSTSAELHFEQGVYQTAAGDTAAAVAAYGRAIALDPRYGEPKVNLGNLLVARGEFSTAVRLYFQAAIADPDLFPAQIAAGNAFLHSGHPDSALPRYDRALTLAPGSTAAAVGRVTALDQLGRSREAIAAARQALVSSGDRADLLTALGRALKNAGRNEEAVAALRGALAREPRRAEAWVTLGQCLRRLGQLDEAEAAEKQAIAIDPELVAAHVNLADIYARRGFYDQAIAALERALAIDPFNTTAIFNLAIVHHELGEEAQAIMMLERLLAIDPNHQAGRHALAEFKGEPSLHPHPKRP